MTAPPVSIRSTPLECPPKIAAASSLDVRTHNPLLGLVPGTDVSFAEARRLRVNWKKVGQFVVKCLGDLARNSTMMGSWP